MHWCWLCGEGPIPSSEVGGHFASGAGACAGKQFEGMDDAVEIQRLLREAGGDLDALEPEQRELVMDTVRDQYKGWRNHAIGHLLISGLYIWLFVMWLKKRSDYE